MSAAEEIAADVPRGDDEPLAGDKACTKCKQRKPLEAFHRSGAHRTGRRHWCKACVAAYMRDRGERVRGRRGEPRQKLFSAFTAEVGPHVRVRVERLHGVLTGAQAETLKRLVAAYIDQVEPLFPPDIDLTGVELRLDGAYGGAVPDNEVAEAGAAGTAPGMSGPAGGLEAGPADGSAPASAGSPLE